MKTFLVNIKTVKTGKVVVTNMGVKGNSLQSVVKQLRIKYPLKSYIIKVVELK